MGRSVLIVGSSSIESLESSYGRAFRSLGWSVHLWDPARALRNVARGKKLGRIFSTFVHVEPWARKANLEMLKLADELRPDLILVIATSGVRAGTLAQIRVRIPNALIFCVYPDSPHNLDGDRTHCFPFFDLVTTSSPAWVDAFVKLGASRVHYLPFAADTELYRPASLESQNSSIAHDVVFIGTWRPEREQLLEQLADFNLRVWGSDYWKSRTRAGSPLREQWGGRQIAGDEFARVCAESKIMMNILDPATWPGPNMRAFEQAACRAFSLSTRSQAVLDYFKEGETIECFDSVEEARDKISFYLNHENERRRVADASYRFVVEEGHTYIDRVKQLIDWLENR